MSSTAPFSVTRILNAPRPLVFLAWTDVAHLMKWMGPAGSTVLKADLDLRPGGSYHYGLKNPDGSTMWGKQVYLEITPPEKLIYLQSFSDPSGGLVRHPMAPSWPLQMLSTTTFEDLGDGTTRVVVTWVPHQADAAAEATFDGARGGMQHGFAGMFATLDAHLAATERTLMHSRVVNAPPKRVWRALTDPAQVNVWWGPRGFANTQVEQDVRVGGTWKFVMVGPDGTAYPNTCTYLELVEGERLVYDHGDGERVLFRGEISLQAVGDQTLVTLAVHCASRAFRDSLLGYAIDGGQQTLTKLGEFLGRAER